MSPFQDEEYQPLEGSTNSPRRLPRSQRCLPNSTNESPILEISPVYMEGNSLQVQTLPFGLATALITFTKLLRPVAAHLRSQGIRLLIYLDNILLAAQTSVLATHQMLIMTNLLESLGFKLNQKKCILSPSQTLEFLGFQIRRHELNEVILITREGAENQKRMSPLASVTRDLSKTTDTLNWADDLNIGNTPSTPPLQDATEDALSSAVNITSRLQYLHSLDTGSSSRFGAVGRPDVESQRLADFTQTSRSLPRVQCLKTGLGGILPNNPGKDWSTMEPTRPAGSFNVLELQAAFFATQTFLKTRTDVHVLIYLDNTVAVQYINRMGGIQSLAQLAVELWEWCLARKIILHAEHLPGRLNTRTDFKSRHHNDSSNWRLHPQVFNVLNQVFGPFSTDLFVSFQNAHVDHFFSWKPDPQAAEADAFSQPWNKLHPYAFILFALISRCLQKAREEKVAHLLLIAPVWPAQGWYPILLDMLVEIPRILPKRSDILLNPQGESHSLVIQNHLTLAAWPVSGIPSKQAAFQKTLKDYTVPLGEEAQQNNMSQHGENGPCSWCHERNTNPFQVSIYSIIEYLTKLFQEGKEHSTINTTRSMLSVTLPPIDGSVIGKHPLVCQFMQGILNSRPPKPRYKFVWDVNLVISHIQAGVDTTAFKAHSTRLAATSAAHVAGVSVADIMKTADWTRESTFRRYYYKPIQDSAFGHSILSHSK